MHPLIRWNVHWFEIRYQEFENFIEHNVQFHWVCFVYVYGLGIWRWMKTKWIVMRWMRKKLWHYYRWEHLNKQQQQLHESHIADDTNAKFISHKLYQNLTINIRPMFRICPTFTWYCKIEIIIILVGGEGRIIKLLMDNINEDVICTGREVVWNYQALIKGWGDLDYRYKKKCNIWNWQGYNNDCWG